MRSDIWQKLEQNPDLILYLRQNPKWYRFLNRYPERYEIFHEKYLEERKLTLNDKIEQINQTIQLVKMFIE